MGTNKRDISSVASAGSGTSMNCVYSGIGIQLLLSMDQEIAGLDPEWSARVSRTTG